MKPRDLLTILSALALAIGPALKSHGGSELEWRIGDILTSVGGALLASRAFGQSTPRKPRR